MRARLAYTLILGAVVFSNTFSPQYLIWISPFAAFLSPVESGGIVLASFLTWLYFRNWDDLIDLQPLALSILIARNLILVILLLGSFFQLARKIHQRNLPPNLK